MQLKAELLLICIKFLEFLIVLYKDNKIDFDTFKELSSLKIKFIRNNPTNLADNNLTDKVLKECSEILMNQQFHTASCSCQ